MSAIIRWGIVGTGHISRRFAEELRRLDDAKLVAVSSRTQTSADAFAETFNVPNRHVGAASLAGDPDVDAVYIGTPHAMHREDTLACLQGGKAVLCEKPMALNAREAGEMVAEARRRKLFLMEAMWTYCLPAVQVLRRCIQDGAIGEVRMVQASFGYRGDWGPRHRLMDPDLGGGALLDVGVYPIAFARLVFDRPPERITGLAHMSDTGVDEQSSVLLAYPGGAMAVLSCAVRTWTDHAAFIYGTEGYLRVPSPFFMPDRFYLTRGRGEKEEEFVHPRTGHGFVHEAEEVMGCIRRGETESRIVPLEVTLDTLRTMDTLREQWGLVYPSERQQPSGH